MLDSAEFWRAPDVDPAEIQTEVLYLPATHWVERAGSFTNSGRWAQWKEQAIDAPDGVRSDTWILSELFWRVKELYEAEGGAYHEPILNLQWNYLNQREPGLEELAQEINGSDLRTGELLSSFGQLRDDGTTTSGNWLYTGSFTEEGNMMARRGTDDPSEWASITTGGSAGLRTGACSTTGLRRRGRQAGDSSGQESDGRGEKVDR